MKKHSLAKAFVLFAALAVVVGVIFAARGMSSAALAARQRQNFFEQFFIAGGPVVWFVLFPMSLVTMYLVAEHALTINRKNLLGNGRLKEQISGLTGQQLQQALAEREDLVSIALRDGIDKGCGDWFRMRSIIQESLQDRAGRLLRRIEWLNLIGGVSPMVGLFGTVFGMIKLFDAIVTAGGQPQPAHLADGIGVALVTTFWGLFIAIPALAMHGVFRNRIEVLVSEAVTQSEAVMPILREVLKQQSPQQPKAQPMQFRNVPIVPMQDKTPEATKTKNTSK